MSYINNFIYIINILYSNHKLPSCFCSVLLGPNKEQSFSLDCFVKVSLLFCFLGKIVDKSSKGTLLAAKKLNDPFSMGCLKHHKFHLYQLDQLFNNQNK